jgi:O-6-methylguanine DNA methyltransferase
MRPVALTPKGSVMEFRHALLSTLAGPLLVVADQSGLRRIHILPEADVWRTELARLAALALPDVPRDAIILTEDPDGFKTLAQQLGEYFAGLRRRFDVPLSPHGTDFQVKVWRQLLDIPWGQLRSYSQLAADLGEPRAARAVGQAAAQNPLPILVPCHRLLGTDGSLVGFAGGTDLKARLLRLEGHTLADGERVRPPRLF